MKWDIWLEEKKREILSTATTTAVFSTKLGTIIDVFVLFQKKLFIEILITLCCETIWLVKDELVIFFWCHLLPWFSSKKVIFWVIASRNLVWFIFIQNRCVVSYMHRKWHVKFSWSKTLHHEIQQFWFVWRLWLGVPSKTWHFSTGITDPQN